MRLTTWYGVIFGVVFLLDRFTKQYMIQAPGPYYLNEFLSFQLSFNRGISWGLFNSDSTPVFVAVSALIMAFIVFFALYTIIRWLNHNLIFGEVLVLAGALSNMVDRILYKGVADFIMISLDGWVWPAFNIADVCIVGGVLLMFAMSYNES